jgi:hypothetical protein
MWKLSQGLLYAILIVLMASGAYARGGPLHLYAPTTKPNNELPEAGGRVDTDSQSGRCLHMHPACPTISSPRRKVH